MLQDRTEHTTQDLTRDLTRRRFLQGGCLVLAAASLPGAVALMNVSTVDTAEAAQMAGFKPHAFLEIAPDGGITVWVGQTNLGQGTHTGIPMVIADELDADWTMVQSRMALAADPFKDPEWGVQATGGSTSIRHRWDLLRSVGAGARLMLIQAAADIWGIPASDCTASQGKVHAPDGRSLSYGQLTAEAAKMEAPTDPPFKAARDYTIMGTYRQRLDLADKVHGRTAFGLDVQRPGMLVAVLDRPPQYGATPLSYDEQAALAVPGVAKVMALNGKVAVCAANTWAALQGRKALGTKWSQGSHPDLSNATIADLFQREMAKPGGIAQDIGNADQALSGAAVTLEARYTTPYLSHAQLEPTNCTAFVEADRCRVWAPTQGQTYALWTAAGITGLPEDKVEVMTTPCGGGFGRRAETEVVEEAVSLSKALGKPVKVMWTREDDFADDVYRPGCVCEIHGGLDRDGNLVAWRHKVASQSIMARLMPDAVQNGIDGSSLMGVADMPYAMPNRLVEHVLIELPMRVGWLRSVAYASNAFGVECFLDELAAKAGRDPLEFRLDLLEPGSRPHRVLTALADKSGWKDPLPKGVYRGMALVSCFESVVAHVAEVSVDRKSGKVTVHRMVAVVDCGTSIYPDAIEAQTQGGMVMGLSMAFNEAMQFADGGAATANYDQYPLLSMTGVPPIEVHIVDSGAKAGGIGEPVVPSVAPAVANAIFAATGVRLRDLPLNLDALKQA